MKITRFIKTSVATLALASLFGCAELDQGLRKTADQVAPRDIVSGKRTLNPESEKSEIERTAKQQQQILNAAKSNGIAVNTDAALLSQLNQIMQRIAQVSHRPNLSWEVHLIEDPDVNAGTIGGGKIFFKRGIFGGLIDQNNEDEIAAVMAHEMGHVTARHVGKKMGLQLAGMLSSKAKKATASKIYQGSFTTLQEDEADRIGLLYMALAGYDPSKASAIWQRDHQKNGSDPKNYEGGYAYDHSMPLDRANKTAELAPIAQKYFKGQGQINSDYQEILANNDLLPKSNISEENGYLAALHATLDTYTQHLKAKTEELSRQAKMQQEQNAIRQQAAIQQLTRIDFQIGNSSNGYKALFGNFINGSNTAISRAIVTVVYINASGAPIYTEDVLVQSNYIPPGQAANWSAYVKNVPSTADIRAVVKHVEWKK